LARCHLVANLLESQEIPATVMGEQQSTLAGATATPWVEVCVHEENRGKAEVIVDQFIRSGRIAMTPRSSAWTCPNCGEVIEPQFTDCWKCQTPRPADDDAAAADKPAPRPPPDPNLPIDVPCLMCQYNLRTLPIHGRCPECGHPVFPSLFAKVRALDGTLEPMEMPFDVLRPCLDWFEQHLGFPLEAVAFAEYVGRATRYSDVDALTTAIQDRATEFFGDAITASRALDRWNIRTTADLRRLITALIDLGVVSLAPGASGAQ
jgi:hypothetical protein